jgi:hypothetical protein
VDIGGEATIHSKHPWMIGFELGSVPGFSFIPVPGFSFVPLILVIARKTENPEAMLAKLVHVLLFSAPFYQ